jgi:hypothetical protein
MMARPLLGGDVAVRGDLRGGLPFAWYTLGGFPRDNDR